MRAYEHIAGNASGSLEFHICRAEKEQSVM